MDLLVLAESAGGAKALGRPDAIGAKRDHMLRPETSARPSITRCAERARRPIGRMHERRGSARRLIAPPISSI